MSCYKCNDMGYNGKFDVPCCSLKGDKLIFDPWKIQSWCPKMEAEASESLIVEEDDLKSVAVVEESKPTKTRTNDNIKRSKKSFSK